MPSYTKTPFTDGVTALTASFLNTLQDWIVGMQDANINAVGSGQLTMQKLGLSTGTLKRIARFSSTGTGSAQTVNHGLGEQPDIVILQYAGNFGSAPTHPPYYWGENSTQVNVKADSGYFYYGLAIKF